MHRIKLNMYKMVLLQMIPHIFMHYDTICPVVENSFSLRYDLSRQLHNLSVKWVIL